jgi:hypothetical protein
MIQVIPLEEGNYDIKHSRQSSIKKILRESIESLHMMSTARLNFNPTDTDTLNTARTNLISTFDSQVYQQPSHPKYYSILRDSCSSIDSSRTKSRHWRVGFAP